MRAHGLGPFVLELVNSHQELQRDRRLAPGGCELLEELFGAVVQPGSEIVACEFGDRGVAVALVETRLVMDVLVHADRAVDLAAPPIEAAQREMRVDGLVVEFGDGQERLERAIGLVVEQETHALEVTRAAAVTALATLFIAPGGHAPAGGERARHQQPEICVSVHRRRHPERRLSRVDGGALDRRASASRSAWRRRPRSASNSATQRERARAPASSPAENASSSARPDDTSNLNAATSTSNGCWFSAANSSASTTRKTRARLKAMRRNISGTP
jgi:hypothetical protein